MSARTKDTQNVKQAVKEQEETVSEKDHWAETETGTESDITKKRRVATWGDMFNALGVKPVIMAYNVSGVDALSILRDVYCDDCENGEDDLTNPYDALRDEYLDDVVEAYEYRSTEEQLCALGSAMQELGLRLVYMNVRNRSDVDGSLSNGYRVWIHAVSNTQEYLDLYKGMITRRCFFDNINTFSLKGVCVPEKPDDDVYYPMFDLCVQAFSPSERKAQNMSRPFFLKDGKHEYLCIPIDVISDRSSGCVRDYRVFDTETLRKVKSVYSFDRHALCQHRIEVVREDNTSSVFVSDDCAKTHYWHLEDNGICEDETDSSVPFMDNHFVIFKDERYAYYREKDNVKSPYIVRVERNTSCVSLIEVPIIVGMESKNIHVVTCRDGKRYIAVGSNPNKLSALDIDDPMQSDLMVYSGAGDGQNQTPKTGHYEVGHSRVFLRMDDGRVFRLKDLSDMINQRQDGMFYTHLQTSTLYKWHDGKEVKTQEEPSERFSHLRRGKRAEQKEYILNTDMTFGSPESISVTRHITLRRQ